MGWLREFLKYGRARYSSFLPRYISIVLTALLCCEHYTQSGGAGEVDGVELLVGVDDAAELVARAHAASLS